MSLACLWCGSATSWAKCCEANYEYSGGRISVAHFVGESDRHGHHPLYEANGLVQIVVFEVLRPFAGQLKGKALISQLVHPDAG